MKVLWYATLSLMAASAGFSAEMFYLKHDQTGRTFGPFVHKEGATLTIGEATFTLTKKAPGPLTLRQKLSSTILPELKFRNASLADALDSLRKAGVINSPAEKDEDKVVNIVLRRRRDAADGPMPTITYNARNIALGDALNAVARAADMKVRITGNIVYIVPRK